MSPAQREGSGLTGGLNKHYTHTQIQITMGILLIAYIAFCPNQVQTLLNLRLT